MVDRDDSFRKYVATFNKETTSEALEKLIGDARNVEKILLEKNIITRDDERIERWRSKIEDLRENNDKLRRLFVDYEQFLLPYEAKNKNEVEELYDSMIESIDLMNNKNMIARYVLESIEKSNINLLNIDKDDQEKLNNFLGMH